MRRWRDARGAQRAAGLVSLPRALSKRAVCSRREAERLVLAGRVRVNGSVVRDPAARVLADADRIEVDGRQALAPRHRTVVALNKPAGFITTRSDPGGRPTIYALLAGLERWLFPVGRLDRDTSGLLILTDDHQLGQLLTDPVHSMPKVYHARVKGVPAREALEALRQGVALSEGVTTRPARVRSLGAARDSSSWIEIELGEGRNRQVRRMCGAVGHDVVELVRVRIGGLDLGDLPPGEWRELTQQEVERLVEAKYRGPGSQRQPRADRREPIE